MALAKRIGVDGDLEQIAENAREAASFLKALAHESRLMILCILSQGEKSVSDIETLLAQRQSAVSQQLARLRLEGLVTTRRDGKAVYYSLGNDDVRTILTAVYGVFCHKTAKDAPGGGTDV